MEHRLAADACAAEPEPPGGTGGPSAGSAGDEPAATVTTTLGLSWKAAALQWKAEANALRAENERLARTAHTFLGASKVSPSPPPPTPRACALAVQLASMTL